uniref:Uncharacterized protein n=1 Tax=Phlebotomus papatasi TaxID=29031 RepID=A0A1B0DGN9_PHLPP
MCLGSRAVEDDNEGFIVGLVVAPLVDDPEASISPEFPDELAWGTCCENCCLVQVNSDGLENFIWKILGENHQAQFARSDSIADTEVKKSESNSSDIKGITVKSDEELLDTRPPKPVDWRPQDKCYFCVDGKLLAVNERGELVAESGPVNAEPDLANTTPLDSDSDTSESCSEAEVQNPAAAFAAATQKSVAALLRGSVPPNMTSLESMAAQFAAVASLQGLPTGLAPFYP